MVCTTHVPLGPSEAPGGQHDSSAGHEAVKMQQIPGETQEETRKSAFSNDTNYHGGELISFVCFA